MFIFFLPRGNYNQCVYQCCKQAKDCCHLLDSCFVFFIKSKQKQTTKQQIESNNGWNLKKKERKKSCNVWNFLIKNES